MVRRERAGSRSRSTERKAARAGPSRRAPVPVIDLSDIEDEPVEVDRRSGASFEKKAAVAKARESHEGPTRESAEQKQASGSEPIVIDDVDEVQAPLEMDVDHSAEVARIMEIIVDVCPEHVLELVEKHSAKNEGNVAETVIHLLFENPSYPKATRKGKRKHIEDESSSIDRPRIRPKIDYGSKDRRPPAGTDYKNLSLIQLQTDFPYIPKPSVVRRFNEHNGLYAPTFVYLEEEQNSSQLSYTRKVTAYRPPGGSKGKARSIVVPELEEEKEWLERRHQAQCEERDAAFAAKMNDDEYEQCEAKLECGCCFDMLPFENFIQCEDGHLFCKDCMTGFAETKLGEQNVNILCMDQSGCKAPFPHTELKRFLSEKLHTLYERIKQRKEIEAAGLQDLEECPFCDFKCVIENADEKLFRCGNIEGCGAVTCRGCKKPDHLPKSCKEMEEDKKLNGLHHVEEAMTEALIRKCPQCNQPFLKEFGCNKMSCPNCGTLSCYICRAIITGYDHFDQRRPEQAGISSSSSKKCNLWDPVEQRHDAEVKDAEARARAEYKERNPDAQDEDLKVEVPQTALAPPPNPLGVQFGVGVPQVVPLAPAYNLNAGHLYNNAHALFQQIHPYPAPQVHYAQIPALYPPPAAPAAARADFRHGGHRRRR